MESQYAESGFFQQLEQVLAKSIGPVASYIIEDVLLDLNQSREQFLKDNIPLLTESISMEIEDENKRVQFQEEMLEIIKKI